ncbi:PssD/Cps14F family polysaccharide biosynthesis glycosyltransferase [Paenibacillus thailandensis]|uniref:PssD/Cps14F family polysaccharide biosynthesis glycosyltransferase n=1 Tax=Paenibacillus thailandensis TaxID=393250 RepID=A0ABW5R2R0_9BACL
MDKICLVSSTGGHLAQLKQIIPILSNYNYFVVTEFNKMSDNNNKEEKYYLKQQERKNILFLYCALYNIIISIYIILRERPSIIISTGAGAVIPICLFGKLMGSKLVFIESFAKISTPTLTGKILYRFSDRFYVQWEQLIKYYPNSVYRGTIY